MNFSSQFAAVQPAAARRTALITLIALGALIVLARAHTYDEPLERDITTYAVVAHELLNGKALYSDVWDHKPPAIHITYALGELIAGYGRNSVFLINVIANLATLAACYFAGSAGGGRFGGIVAATIWTLVSGDLAIEGNQPNTEVFLNVFLTTAFAIFVGSRKDNIGFAPAALIGALFAIASLYKQIVVVQAAALAFAYFASRSTMNRRQAGIEVAIIAIIGAAAWTAVFGYFFALGRSEAFKTAVFTFNHWYSGNLWHNITNVFRLLGLPDEVFGVALSLIIVWLVGLTLGLVFGPRRAWLSLLALLIATQITVVLPGRFFPHYYQLWLPPLAIGIGWAVASLKQHLPARLSSLSYLVAVAICAVLLVLELPNYRLPAKAWSIRKYGDVFAETEELARKIDKLLPAETTFYEWGNESGFYFTSGRRPPSGVLASYPALTGPVARELSARLLLDLKQSNPELIVSEKPTLKQTPLDHPVLVWLKENYRPFAETENFLLAARNGGRLESQKRLEADQKTRDNWSP